LTERTLTAEELYDLCQDIKEDYGERDSQLDDIQKYYFLDQERDPDTADVPEGIEVVRLPYGSNTVDLVQDLIAGAELGITVPALSETPTDRKLADTAEEMLATVIDQSERSQHQSLLGRATWFAAVRGCVAGRVMAVDSWLEKSDDGEYSTGRRFPLVLQLRDPRYVYPAFGLDGLSCVVEWRKRTVRDIRNSLGDEEMLPDYDAKDEVEWVEYWDSKRFCYWAGAEPVARGAKQSMAGPWPNLYGGIPYSYEFARQSGILAPDKRARPLLGAMRHVIDRLDLLDSAEATALLKYMGDALAYYTDKARPIDLSSGAINIMDPMDRLEWIHSQRTPPQLDIAHNKYSSQLERGTFPSSMYGLDPGRMMAGYAINMLNQSGQMRLATIIECLQRWLAAMLENGLMVCENYLSDLLGGQIPFYSMTDAEDQAGNRRRVRREQKLDARKFGGFYSVEVRIGDLLPADEQAAVVLALKSREPGPDGRPLMSWETAIEKWKLTQSPSEERERINREIAASDPMVMALQQALYTAELLEEYVKQLEKKGINPDEVLAEIQATPPPEEAPPPGPPMPPGGVPPQVLPGQMQGQMMPQPGLEEGLPGVPMPAMF